jgi:nanoRNase/pAp phosphatase (c-di-AMP/oligoRNAs hydrolase)
MDKLLDKIEQIKELFEGSRNIAIMPSKIAGIDAFAAGVGLYFMLKDEGKDVALVYPGATPEEYGRVEGVDIVSNSGRRELLVSVDYSGTDASKVNYSTQNDILHFSIGPVDSNFDLSRVKTEIRGFNFDLIVTIGAQVSGDLGNAFKDAEGEFGKADVLNIDNTDKNRRFGSINAVDSSVESLSLLTLNLAVSCGMKVVGRAAEALLKGISKRKGI